MSLLLAASGGTSQPTPTGASCQVSPRNLNQPAPAFFRGIFPLAVGAAVGFFATAPQPVVAQPQPVFYKGIFQPAARPAKFVQTGPQFQDEAPQPQAKNRARFFDQPRLQFAFASPQETFHPAPYFGKVVAPAPVSALRPFSSVGPQSALFQPQPGFSLVAPPVAAAVLPTPASLALQGRSLFQPAPWFASFSDNLKLPAGNATSIPQQWPEVLQSWFSRLPPPSVQPAAQTPVGASWAVQPRPLQQPSPVFYKLSSPAGILPSADLHANWQQVAQILQPTFQRGPIVSTPPPAPGPEIPTQASLAQSARSLFQPPAQFFKTNTYPAAAAAVQIPTAASLSQQTRHLDQPQPYFKGFSPKPSFLPPNLFGAIPGQSPEQQSPVFSRQTPPSVAPTSPPLRPTAVSIPLQSVEQRSPVFAHQPPPSFVPPPVIFQDGSVGDSIRKRRVEDVRLPRGKSARQEIKDLWNPVPVPPVQLALFNIPDLVLPPNPEDDIIPALLLLGML